MSRIRIFPLLLLPLFFFGMISSQRFLDQFRTPESELKESLYLPDGKILKIVSLGFNSVLADFLWIRSVLYFGKHIIDEDNPYSIWLVKSRGIVRQKEEMGGKQDHFKTKQLKNPSPSGAVHTQVQTSDGLHLGRDPHLSQILYNFDSKDLAPYIYPLLQRVVELNPYFIYPYQFGGIVVLHDTGEITAADSLLRYGLRFNPQRWEIPFYLGYLELFYRDNPQKALEWLSRALILPGSPPFLHDLYTSITKSENATVRMIEYLKALFHSTKDEKTRAQILKLIEQLARV